MKRLLSLVMFTILMCLSAFSQIISNDGTAQRFALVKEQGHYYFDAELNGVPVRMMLESGVPSLMIGEKMYEENKSAFNLKTKPSKGNMRFLNGTYKIKYMADGRLSLGKACYDGPIFILEGFEDGYLPVQYLKNGTDSSSIVMVDLQDKVLEVKDGSFMTKLGNDYQKLNISLRESGNMPVVDSPLTIVSKGKSVTVGGHFIVDFGNGSLLFLMKQSVSAQKIISSGVVELSEACNAQGKVVAEGMLAEKLSICDRTFDNVSVGVTDKMTTIEETGFLGLKYFTGPVIFDFTNKIMLVK